MRSANEQRLDVAEVSLLLDELFRVRRLSLDDSSVMSKLQTWRSRQTNTPRPAAPPSVDAAALLDALSLDPGATTDDALARVDRLAALARGALALAKFEDSQRSFAEEGTRLVLEMEIAATPLERQLLMQRLSDWARGHGARPSE